MPSFSKSDWEKYRESQKRQRLLKSLGYDSRRANAFAVSKALPLKGRILEIGTGWGNVTALLARTLSSIVTVDVDAVVQRQAKLHATLAGVRRRIRFRTVDGTSLPYEDGAFDGVVSVNALHHFKDPRQVFREMLRVVRSGGKIIVADANKAGLRALARLHNTEGKKHPESGISIRAAAEWFKKYNCRVKIYRGGYQDVAIVVPESES